MIRIVKQVFLPSRFFIAASASIVVFAVSFIVPLLFALGLSILVSIVVLTLADGILLISNKRKLQVVRVIPNLLSLGDENKISITVKNNTGLDVQVVIYDELPYQLQMRNAEINALMKKDEERVFEYVVTPTSRGNYNFGRVNVLVTSIIGF